MKETLSYKPVRITFTEEAQELDLQLFTRKDDSNADKPEHLKYIYFRFHYTGTTRTGQKRKRLSGIKSTHTQDEAEALAYAIEWRKRFLRLKRSGRSTNQITLQALIRSYLDSDDHLHRSKSTQNGMHQVLSRYSHPSITKFHSLDIDDARRNDFLAMFAQRAEHAGEIRRRNNQSYQLTSSDGKLSATTLHKECSQLRKVIRWASRTNVLPSAAEILTRFPTSTELTRRPELAPFIDFATTGQAHNAIFTNDEIRQLLATIRSFTETLEQGKSISTGSISLHRLPSIRLCLATTIVASFGVRIQEVMRLLDGDLRFEGELYSIRMNDAAKTRKASNINDRHCFAPEHQPIMARLLSLLLKERQTKKLARNTKYLFHNGASAGTVKSIRLKPLLLASNIPTRRSHGERGSALTFTALRRTTISAMVSAGVKIEDAADLHGTSPSQVEASYRRSGAEGARRAAKAVPSLF